MRPLIYVTATLALAFCSVLQDSHGVYAAENSKTVECVRAQLSNNLQLPPALSKLKEYIESKSNFLPQHKLELTPTVEAKLKIGVLYHDQKQFLALCIRAAKEGSLSEIDAGRVLSPKVFIMLNHLMVRVPKANVNMVIKGIFSEHIFKTARKEQSAGIMTRRVSKDPDVWNEQEIRDFEAAVRNLGLSRCRNNACAFEIRIKEGRAEILLTAGGKPI